MTTGAIVGLVIGIIVALIAGGFAGFFIAKSVMKKQLKKNPPITKDTIRMLYSQMGRKPTEQQVNDLYNRATKVR
ncbi:MAG: YneF family protein [Ureaplasma sp.]|nr:YneF family protein [Ureaplasma sp.]MDE6289831.1 YneF family protein [Ureaplasma sp.]